MTLHVVIGAGPVGWTTASLPPPGLRCSTTRRARPIAGGTIGPIILALVLSGDVLAATTGLTAGILMLATAVAGFHQLAQVAAPSTIVPS